MKRKKPEYLLQQGGVAPIQTSRMEFVNSTPLIQVASMPIDSGVTQGIQLRGQQLQRDQLRYQLDAFEWQKEKWKEELGLRENELRTKNLTAYFGLVDKMLNLNTSTGISSSAASKTGAPTNYHTLSQMQADADVQKEMKNIALNFLDGIKTDLSNFDPNKFLDTYKDAFNISRDKQRKALSQAYRYQPEIDAFKKNPEKYDEEVHMWRYNEYVNSGLDYNKKLNIPNIREIAKEFLESRKGTYGVPRELDTGNAIAVLQTSGNLREEFLGYLGSNYKSVLAEKWAVDSEMKKAYGLEPVDFETYVTSLAASLVPPMDVKVNKVIEGEGQEDVGFFDSGIMGEVPGAEVNIATLDEINSALGVDLQPSGISMDPPTKDENWFTGSGRSVKFNYDKFKNEGGINILFNPLIALPIKEIDFNFIPDRTLDFTAFEGLKRAVNAMVEDPGDYSKYVYMDVNEDGITERKITEEGFELLKDWREQVSKSYKMFPVNLRVQADSEKQKDLLYTQVESRRSDVLLMDPSNGNILTYEQLLDKNNIADDKDPDIKFEGIVTNVDGFFSLVGERGNKTHDPSQFAGGAWQVTLRSGNDIKTYFMTMPYDVRNNQKNYGKSVIDPLMANLTVAVGTDLRMDEKIYTGETYRGTAREIIKEAGSMAGLKSEQVDEALSKINGISRPTLEDTDTRRTSSIRMKYDHRDKSGTIFANKTHQAATTAVFADYVAKHIPEGSYFTFEDRYDKKSKYPTYVLTVDGGKEFGIPAQYFDNPELLTSYMQRNFKEFIDKNTVDTRRPREAPLEYLPGKEMGIESQYDYQGRQPYLETGRFNDQLEDVQRVPGIDSNINTTNNPPNAPPIEDLSTPSSWLGMGEIKPNAGVVVDNMKPVFKREWRDTIVPTFETYASAKGDDVGSWYTVTSAYREKDAKAHGQGLAMDVRWNSNMKEWAKTYAPELKATGTTEQTARQVKWFPVLDVYGNPTKIVVALHRNMDPATKKLTGKGYHLDFRYKQ